MTGGNDVDNAAVGPVCGVEDGAMVAPRCVSGVIAPFVSGVDPEGIAAIFSS